MPIIVVFLFALLAVGSVSQSQVEGLVTCGSLLVTGVSANLSSMAQATQVIHQHDKYRVYTIVPVVYTMPVYKCHSAGH